MKSIACIGNGFVGGSLTTVFSERNTKVYVFDKAKKLAPGGIDIIAQRGGEHNITTFLSLCEEDQNFSGVFFIAVPTPMRKDGSADLSIIESVLTELAQARGSKRERVAVIKSTCPPGSTDRWNELFKSSMLRIVFNPEFLREASAVEDMRNQTRIILGGPRPHINLVKQIYEAAFPLVPIIKTSSTTAEMVKYITNVHLAVKVSLANEFYQICQALDANGANIDYDKVIEYATLDERLGKSHWKVPGPMPADDTGEPAFGFGGSCFVKDLNALMYLATSLGITPSTMSGAWTKNLEVRKQRDWEKLVGRAISDIK
jgi:UDPglucose 6-dehydrogenase